RCALFLSFFPHSSFNPLLSLCFSVSIYLSVSPHFTLSFYLSHRKTQPLPPDSFFFSLFLYFCFSLSLSLSLSLTDRHTHSHHTLSFFLSLYISVFFSLSLSLSLC